MAEKSSYFVFSSSDRDLVQVVFHGVVESPLFDIVSSQASFIEDVRGSKFQVCFDRISKIDRSRLAFFVAGLKSGWNRHSYKVSQEVSNVR